jgi:photosystem I P700 chlorophyll a apoprotein A1
MYRTNWGIGHSMKEILEAHKGPFTGEGHVGLYEILTTSWHSTSYQLSFIWFSFYYRSSSHVCAMPPYPYLATDYGTQLSLSLTTFGLVVSVLLVLVHAAIFMVRDYDPTNNYNNL